MVAHHHAGGRRRSVPVLLVGWALDYVARSNHPDGAAPALHQSATGRHNQRLAQRMRVPRRSGTRLERNVGPGHAGRRVGHKQRVDAHRSGEVLGGPWFGGLGPSAFEFHRLILPVDRSDGHPCPSAVDQLLAAFGIASPYNLDQRSRAVDLLEIVRCDLEVHGSEVLLQALQPGSPGDGHDPRFLG